jgi:hypothetical protein
MFSLLIKLAELIADEVDKEYYSLDAIKNHLMILEQSLKDGKITEEEYEEQESELLERLSDRLEEQNP